jgi:hypothetical protein
MPRKPANANRPGRKRAEPADDDAASLIDWHEPERNAHVLDWRERAQEFGLTAGDDHGETVVLPPEQLIEEDDPEAFERQPMAEDEDEEPSREDADEANLPGVGREDLDLVRVYLKHVGRRKLLKAREEQEIGRRIEAARAELQATLGTIPCAVHTLHRVLANPGRAAPNRGMPPPL